MSTATSRHFDPSAMTSEALAAICKAGTSRRDFLRSAGFLIVGFSMAGRKLSAQSPVNPSGVVDATQVDSWIAIGADESVTAYSGKCEFGQGFSTVQVQLVAEELNVPLSRVRLIFCDTGVTPDQGTTSGSQSTVTEFSNSGLRQALCTARDALLQLASQQLEFGGDVVALQLNVDFSDSGFLLGTSGLHFGDLVLQNLTTTPALNGLTVRQVLADTNIALGGGPPIYDIVTLDGLLVALNASFVEGRPGGFAQTNLAPPSSVPEPSTLLLLLPVMAGLGWSRRFKRDS